VCQSVSWLYGVVVTFVVPVSLLSSSGNDRVAEVRVVPASQLCECQID